MSSEASPSKSWTVDVDGAERRVVVETDPESGRTQIRVDGRMAARPLGAQENERSFMIGSVGYVLRRDENGELELDVDANAEPLPAVAPPAWKLKPVKEAPTFTKTKIIGIILTLLLIPAARWTIDVVRYMRVPWKAYDAQDHQWRVSFPAPPKETRDVVTTGGVTMKTVKLESRYHNHLYILEWIELPFPVPPEKEAELITGALDGMVKNEQSKLLVKNWGTVARHDAMHFVMQMPKNETWSGGTARGLIVRHDRRLYIQYAYVPRRESMAFDVGEYLRSLDLP
jgi:hypothetical protein